MTQTHRHPGLVPGSTAPQTPSSEPQAVSPAARWTPEQVRGDGGLLGGARAFIAALGLLTLTACGKAAGLAPRPGEQLPIAPRGARVTPTPAELLTPTAQQRPQRGDELLRSSQERRSDEFDLPPPD